jgi:hemerythrin-like metal-binding protein
MESKFLLGIPEIDAQHEEISDLVNSLQGVISRQDQGLLIHPMMQRLHQLLLAHFANEESFMETIHCADISRHKEMHKEMVELLENSVSHPPASGDYEYLGKLIGEKLFSHILENDAQIAETVKHLLNSINTP